MPAQPVHEDLHRQQIVVAFDVDLPGCQALQGKQIQRPAQQIRFGFGPQMVVGATMAILGVPDIGSVGGDGLERGQ